jgi:hypothetical protein
MPRPLSGRDPWAWVLANTEKVTESGCWIFMGTLLKDGYAYIRIGSRTDGTRRRTSMQRFVHESQRGPIPPGYEVDHRCRVRCCVNPDHLLATSVAANRLSSSSPMALNAAKVECSKCGDPYVDYGYQRKCRRCDAASHRRRYAARTSRKES